MRLFDNFDPEKKIDPETKINRFEKTAMLTFSFFIKRAVRRAIRAKTYGELYEMIDKVGNRIDILEKNFKETENTEENFTKQVKELEDIAKEL